MMMSDNDVSNNDGDDNENDSSKSDYSDEGLRVHDAQGGDVSFS